MKKRIIAMLLVLVMLTGMLPLPAFASETETELSVTSEETVTGADTSESTAAPEETAAEETTVPVETTEAMEETVGAEETTAPAETAPAATPEEGEDPVISEDTAAEDSVNAEAAEETEPETLSEEEPQGTVLDTSDLQFGVDSPDGYVTISFVDQGVRPADAEISDAELYGTALGTIIPETRVPLVEGDTIAAVTMRLLDAMKLEYSSTSSDLGFYLASLNKFELNGRYYETFGELDAGSQSGWMVCLNGWFMNRGASAFAVEDEDVITWAYTCQMGADIGSDFENHRNANITGISLADGTLSLKAGAQEGQYTCMVPENISSLAFEVLLENYSSRVTVTVDGADVKYVPNRAIPVGRNSLIVISSQLQHQDTATQEIVTYTDSAAIQLVTNAAPTVAEDAPTTMDVTVGEELTVDLSRFFTDAEGDALTYHVLIADLGVDQTLEGATFAGTIPAAGTYDVVITVSDGNASVSHTIALTAAEKPNTAPNIRSELAETKSKLYVYSSSYVYIYMDDLFEDADGDTLSYEATLDGETVEILYNTWSKEYYIMFSTKPDLREYKIRAFDGEAYSEEFTAVCVGTSATISVPEGVKLIPQTNNNNYLYYVLGSEENNTFALDYTLDVDYPLTPEWYTQNANVIALNGDGTFTAAPVTSRQQVMLGVTHGKDQYNSPLYLGTRYVYVLPSMPAVTDITVALPEHADNVKATTVSNAITGGWYGSEFDFAVEDPSIADIAISGYYNLVVTPKALGTTKVTATFKHDPSIQCQFSITVTGRSLQIQDQPGVDSVDFAQGKTVQLIVNGAQEGESFTWTSSDEAVAAVDENGLVTVKALGTSYITAVSSLSTEEAPVKAAMYLQVKEGGKVYLEDMAVTQYTYFEDMLSAKSAFNSATLTYDWNLQESRYSYSSLQFTPYFDGENLTAVLHYQVSGGDYQTMELTDAKAVSISNGLAAGENVVTIDVYPKDAPENVTTYTFNIFRPYNPTNTITRMTVYPNGETALNFPKYLKSAEGTIFQVDAETLEPKVNAWGSYSTGWSASASVFKAYVFGKRTGEFTLYPTFGYANQRVMMYVDDEAFGEAVTGTETAAIPVPEDTVKITFHVNSEKYHTEQLAAGVEDPFETPETVYTLYVENVEPLGLDNKILSAQLETGVFYKPGFQSDKYATSALVANGQETENMTFTVPAGIDVYKTSVTAANLLTPEKQDAEGNNVYSVTLAAKNYSYTYGTTKLILQVTDPETGEVGASEYSFTVSQRGSADIYPDEVVEYLNIGSQYTNAGSYGTMPERSLKAGGDTLSLGHFGGYITYKFNTPIQNDPNNPYGVDFVAYGNSFGSGGHEPGYVQVSADGETWYTLAGSDHFEDYNDWNFSVTYTNDGGKSSYVTSDGQSGTIYNYPLAKNYPYFSWTEEKEQSMTFTGPRLASTAKDAYGSAAAVLPDFGYVDVNNNPSAANFGTASNPYDHPGTQNATGDQYDISWAVDESGNPVKLSSISYVRVANASFIYAGAIGEKSTEVATVTRIKNPAAEAVGVTDAPAITVNGAEISVPANGAARVLRVEGSSLQIDVEAAEDANIYINSDNGASRTYTTLPEKGILRIIVQEGQKEPYICYLNLTGPATGTEVDVTWGGFAANDANLTVTSARTPKANYAVLKWVQSFASGFSTPSNPIIVDNCLVFTRTDTLFKVSLADGSVVSSVKMDGSCGYAITSPTYADGMIFCALNGGKLQAFDAKTLESLWVYTDALGGQNLSPITYSDGCIYTGFWTGETKDANYVCINVRTGEKLWSLTHNGGFYWAGSVVIDDVVIVGSDNGRADALLYSLDKKTGEIISTLTLTGMGDQRSALVYSGGHVYFTTKGGYICSAAVGRDNTLSALKSVKTSASTFTPVVYGDYVYYGTSAKQFVIADRSTLETVHTVDLLGYSQHSGLLSTAYVAEEGYLYFYTTYNAKPGGISLIRVDADAPDFTAEGACQLVELYDAKGYEQYCIAAIVADDNGDLYYKNDSGRFFCLGMNEVEIPQITANLPAETKYNFGVDTRAEALTIVAEIQDEGALTYQWQTGTDGESWTDIDGAVQASYTPAITELGQTYYRCVVTNTANGKSAAANSEAAKIIVKEFNTDTGIAYAVTNSNSKPSASVTVHPITQTTTVISTSGNAKPRVWLSAPENGTITYEQLGTGDKVTAAQNVSGYALRLYFSKGVTQANYFKVTSIAEDGTQRDYYLIITADGTYTPISADITVTIANAGQLVLAQKTVTVEDRNGDTRLNVDEALYAAHEAAYEGGAAAGYSSYVGDYGLSLGMLWGDTSGSFGYWLNDSSCWSLDDTVTAGDKLVAFVYQDKTGWSDAYARFAPTTYTAGTGVPLTVTVEKAGYDENWNTVFASYDKAVLTAYDSTFTALSEDAYTVDGCSVTFRNSGTYYLVAAGGTDAILVPAIAKVSVADLMIQAETTELLAGSSVTLRAATPDGKAVDGTILWTMETENEDAAALTVKNNLATLTTANVTEKHTVTVTATVSEEPARQAVVELTILPKAQQIAIYSGEQELTNGTLQIDLNDETAGAPVLTAVVGPEDAGQAVTWSSSNTKVAEVTEGVVTLKDAAGTAKLTAATTDGTKLSASVTVKTVKRAQSIQLTGGEAALVGGKSTTFQAKDGETVLKSSEVQWFLAEGDSAYATLTSAGKLTAKQVLERVTVTVQARISGSTRLASQEVTIYPAVTYVDIEADGETVTGKTLNRSVSQETALTLTGKRYPTDAKEGITWTSSNEKIATVADGVVTYAGTPGTVTITAAATDGTNKKAAVKVSFAVLAEEVTIEDHASELRSGKVLLLAASTTPGKPAKEGITWSLKNSADKDYVTLFANGLLIAKTVYEPHTVVLTAASKDGNASAETTVTIQPKQDNILVLKSGETYVTKTTQTVDLSQGTYELSAAILNGDAETVAWKTSNKNIASLSAAEGETVTVSLRKAGTVTITAVDGSNNKTTVTLKVTNKVSSLDILSTDGRTDGITVASGKSVKLKASVNASASNKSVTWSVAPQDAAYAKISVFGSLTAEKNLMAARTITVYAQAKDGSGVTASQEITIQPLAQGVQIRMGGEILNDTTRTVDMVNVDSLTLTAPVYPRTAGQSVTWKSSNAGVANVDDSGKVTFHKAGTVTITAATKDGSNKKASFKLTVVQSVTEITLENSVIAGGKTLNLSKLMEVGPSDATNKKVTWTMTGDTAFATLSASGTLKTKAVTQVKTVSITAAAADGYGAQATCEVKIYPATASVAIELEGGEVTGKTLSLAAGESLQLTGVNKPGLACQEWTWKSSNEAQAYVDEDGCVTGITAGKTVTITAAANDGTGKKATVKIQITAE